MLTASHRTTKKTQEVLATGNGEMLTFPAAAKTQALSDTATISGPIYFMGLVILSGADAAQMNVTADGNTIFALKTGAASTNGLILPFPVYCPNGITCTRASGTAATFVVYYVEG
jgi:hypothetical protein